MDSTLTQIPSQHINQPPEHDALSSHLWLHSVLQRIQELRLQLVDGDGDVAVDVAVDVDVDVDVTQQRRDQPFFYSDKKGSISSWRPPTQKES